MVETTLSFEKALYLIDDAIKPAYLTKIQELVLRHTWEGKTYSEIAYSYNYDSEYIKSVGCDLWKLLSQSFGKQVNKNNFSQFIRRQIISCSQQTETYQSQSKLIREIKQDQDWGNAPDVSRFQGRTEELEQLSYWSQDLESQMIFISGMVGSGKTLLATKFARQAQQNFDWVVWRSLRNAPPIQELLDNIIHTLMPEVTLTLSTNIDLQILQLLSYLRKHRCLLILDDLQSILESGYCATTYRPGYEEYGQLLRSIIASHHQSLAIITSRNQPKGLKFYEQHKVRFLKLKGFKKSTLKEIYNFNTKNLNSEVEWQKLCDYYLDNPQILKIVTSIIKQLFDGNITQFFQQKRIALEEVENLIQQEFESLSTLEKEISYWLALSNSSLCLEKLASNLIKPVSIKDLLEGINELKDRSLIKKNDEQYTLHVLFADYLKRKLIEQVISN
jgi:hypothetical protein